MQIEHMYDFHYCYFHSWESQYQARRKSAVEIDLLRSQSVVLLCREGYLGTSHGVRAVRIYRWSARPDSCGSKSPSLSPRRGTIDCDRKLGHEISSIPSECSHNRCRLCSPPFSTPSARIVP